MATTGDPNLNNASTKLLNNVDLYLRATELMREIENWERPFTVAYLSKYFKCFWVGSETYDEWGAKGDQIGFVPYEQQAHYYAKAKCALNVMRWQDDCSLNSKIFEITGCRRPCLQAYRSGVENLFEDGEEIVTFRNPAEAAEKLNEMLQMPEGKRMEIAEGGYRRTVREHTWKHRAQRMLKEVEKIQDS